MAQDFDKIFREVLKDIFPALAQKVLQIPEGKYKALPGDLQYTSEREADQLWEVTPAGDHPFILHVEYQTTNDKQMLSRMLLYHAFLFYQKQLPVRQYVIYVGREKLKMEHQVQSDSFSYQYHLVDLRSFSYQTFLESSSSREVLLAILANFEGERGELVAEKIMAKLEQITTSKLELSQRALQLIRLAVLRDLNNTVFNLAKKMAITIDIKDDTLYQQGLQHGKEEGLQQGLQKGKEEGKLAGKEEDALKMLKKGLDLDLISEITELPAERIAQLKQQMEAGQ